MARKNNRPRRVNEILSGLAAVRPVACFAKVYHPVYGLPLELVEELESDWSVLEEFMDRAVMECAPSQRLKDRDDLLRLLGLEGVEMAKSFYSALITQGHIVEGPQGLEYTQLCAKSIQRGRKIYPARSLRRLYVDTLGLIPLTREYQPGTRLIPYNSQDLYISLHHEEGAKVPFRDGLPLDMFDERVVLEEEALKRRILDPWSGQERIERNLPQRVSRVVLNSGEPLEQYFTPYYFVCWQGGETEALDYYTGEPSEIFSPLLHRRPDLRKQILGLLENSRDWTAQQLAEGRGDRLYIPLRGFPRSLGQCAQTGYLDDQGNLHFRVTDQDIEVLLAQAGEGRGIDALHELYRNPWLANTQPQTMGSVCHPVLDEGQLDRLQQTLLEHRPGPEGEEEDQRYLDRLTVRRRPADSPQELARTEREEV